MNFLSNFEDIKILDSKAGEDTPYSGKRQKKGETISPSISNIFNRRRPRVLTPKPINRGEEDYCDEGEDMDSDDRDKEDDIQILLDNPKKRKAVRELTLGRRIEQTLETPGSQPLSP